MVLLGKGGRAFEKGIEFSTSHYPARLVTADFDGDGRADFATNHAANSKVTVLLNRSVP